MRPVQRPEYPGPVVANYSLYLKPLLTAFGHYCSYCEIVDKLDVEHVIPRAEAPDQALNWDNLLLGCPRCNRNFKKRKNKSRDGYLWPDQDDTFFAFSYLNDGRVRIAPNLDEDTAAKAAALMKLVCLDDANQPQQARNLARRRTFGVARHARERYLGGYQTPEEILVQAEAGYWSVWMTVFKDLPDVKNRLLEHSAYPNTAWNRSGLHCVD